MVNQEPSNISAIGLLSGGLDSTLALKIIVERGIQVLALNFTSPFCLCNRKKGCPNIARKAAKELGIEVKTVSIGEDYVELLRNPGHGFGKNVNPCIDCRITMFRKAREIMENAGYSFIITGEVLGQRPMSQLRRSIITIEREAGVEGLVVRPLCGKLLPPTIPEKNGQVSRDWFLEIQGRSRKNQIRIAEEMGIDFYPCPAGGCLLTDPSFAPRVKDLLSYGDNISTNDLSLLKYGRHFRISPDAKLIIGRYQQENVRIEELAQPGDLLLESTDVKGPLSIIRGKHPYDNIELAIRVHARYSDKDTMNDTDKVSVSCWFKEEGRSLSKVCIAMPAQEDIIEELRV